jgi:hypothetical protein
MKAIGKYLIANIDAIAKTGGSFDTFLERGMTKKEQNHWNENFKEQLEA